MRQVPAGVQRVYDLFGSDPLASGETWFFDPTSEGDPTGESPAKALRTAADLNAAKFATSDNLVCKVGTKLKLAEKIRNKRMRGTEGRPFYIGAYRMQNGKPVFDLGGKARPCFDGLEPGKFNPYKGGMNQATLKAMIPAPDLNDDGTFSQGSMEGLFNFYDSVDYELMLWIQDLATRYSGGRAYRFTQSEGGRAHGLLMRNCYSEGTMKQAAHLAGVYDFVIEASPVTLSGVEFNYWNPASNRQAAIASKGTEGDPDTPCNGWFVRPRIWQGWSSEAVNSNSGNRAIGIVDGLIVDQGLFGYYLDRTADMLVGQCIAIRTDGAFKDFTGGEHGRGTCAFEVQNEGHESSFDWVGTYNTAEDFAKYQTHDAVVEQCIAIGFAASFGLQSQASTKKDYVHTGRPHAAGVYFYGGLSINPIESHWLLYAGNNNDAYKLDQDNPPRVWACAHIGAAPFTDRKESQLSDVFRGCYFDRTPPEELSEEAVIGGLYYPVADYPDLSVLMETDEHGWMNETQFAAFEAKVRELLIPQLARSSPIPTESVAYPGAYTLSEFEALDFAGNPYGEQLPLGPFGPGEGGNPGNGGGGNPDNGGEDDLEGRVADLELITAEHDGRLTALESEHATR